MLMNDTIETLGIFAISGLPRRWWINVRQWFLGTAEWNFMRLLPNDSGEMEFPSVYMAFLNRKPFLHRVICLPCNAMQERGYLYGGCVKKA